MPESITHMEYVKLCGIYIKEHMIPMGNGPFIFFDKPNSLVKPPSLIGGVHPDLYYKRSDLLIIGEAKSETDIDNPHSRKQYEYYFKECECFEGVSYMVFCTSWTSCVTLWNMVRRMKRESGYHAHIVVLCESGVYKKD